MTRGQRTGLDVLSYDERVGLLTRAPIGRVGVHLEGHPPAILPINYAFDDEHNIVFRTDTSSILHRAHQHTVAFEIDGIDRLYHLGWSVLVVGTVEEVTNRSECASLASLAARTMGTRPEVPLHANPSGHHHRRQHPPGPQREIGEANDQRMPVSQVMSADIGRPETIVTLRGVQRGSRLLVTAMTV